MEKIKLSQDLSVSRIVHGHMRLVDWNMSNKEILKLTNQVIELGVTTIDQADIYGDFSCEEKLGEVLGLDKSLRSKIEIVTKCGIKFPALNRPQYKSHIYDTSFKHILKSVDTSLKNFNTDYIDLLLIHRPDPLMNPYEVAEAYNKLKQYGKVLNFGVSNFTPSQFNMLQSFLDFKLVTNQIEISPLHLDSFTDGSLDLMIEKRISPMAWSPLGGGNLFYGNDEKTIRVRNAINKVKYELNADSIEQVVYAWLLMHPSNIIPIVGSSNIDRIKSIANSLNLKLTKEQWFEIYVASRGVDIP